MRSVDEIPSVLEGVRVAVVFAFLGGGSTENLREVLVAASSHGCRTVAVVGIPPEFDIRRPSAMEQLAELDGIVDRVVALDVQSALDSSDPDCRFDSVFRILSHATAFALDCVLQLLDGPFFSTLSRPRYTFAYVNTMMMSDAVGAALRKVAFPMAPSIGKLVVAVGSGCTGAEINQIRAAAVFRTGILPDVFRRDDADTNRVVVFAPLARSLLLLPGSAVADDLHRVGEDPHDRAELVLRGDGASHHAPEHDPCPVAPVDRIGDLLHEVVERGEHPLLLLPAGGEGASGHVVGLVHLVHGYGGGMREVEDGEVVGGRHPDEDVALLQLLLEESYVLPAEDERDPVAVSPGALSELPHGDGDTGVVAIALGGNSAGSGDEEASVQGLLEGADGPGRVEDERAVLRSAVGVVIELAGGVDEDEVAEAEVGHGARHGSDVSGEFRSYEDDPVFCHGRPTGESVLTFDVGLVCIPIDS